MKFKCIPFLKVTRGFSLLEVLIALAILSMTMTAILGRQGNILQYSHFIRHATISAQIARVRLLDVEHVYRKDCFETEDGQVFDDACGDEGLFRDFHCNITCVRMEADEQVIEEINGQVEQMMSALSGNEDLDELSDRTQLSGGVESMMPSIDPAMMAQAAGMLTGFIPTFIQILDQKVRKVTLIVTWQEGKKTRTQTFSQYIVNTTES
jgi:prepilin-type N-terminal cleavage/methylation domain-containing protein